MLAIIAKHPVIVCNGPVDDEVSDGSLKRGLCRVITRNLLTYIVQQQLTRALRSMRDRADVLPRQTIVSTSGRLVETGPEVEDSQTDSSRYE
jgi:hypothetical protein